MTTTLPKRFEPFAVDGGLKGPLIDLPVPEILQHLKLSHATGILTLVAGGGRKALYMRDGRVVFASSNLPNDRLGEILLREGKIDRKSTRLNSSHSQISYAVFCLKKKTKNMQYRQRQNDTKR